MIVVRIVSLALALLGFAAPTLGDADDGVLDEAIKTYSAAMNSEERSVRLGGFRRSESLFARAIENGAQNADVYTDMGNAALQGERLGHAVLAYRRALLLDPDHAQALQNLEHARSLLPAWVPDPKGRGALGSFFFWHRTLSRDERQLAAALCFGMAALLTALSIRFGSSTPRNVAILPALAWCVLLASLAFDPAFQEKDAAVITADEVVARAADSTFAPRLFPAPLPGGVEVRVSERRTPWVRIQLANGRDVWVTESSITPVIP